MHHSCRHQAVLAVWCWTTFHQVTMRQMRVPDAESAEKDFFFAISPLRGWPWLDRVFNAPEFVSLHHGPFLGPGFFQFTFNDRKVVFIWELRFGYYHARIGCFTCLGVGNFIAPYIDMGWHPAQRHFLLSGEESHQPLCYFHHN